MKYKIKIGLAFDKCTIKYNYSFLLCFLKGFEPKTTGF